MSTATAVRSAPPTASLKAWPTVYGNRLLGCMREVQHEPLKLYPGAWRQHGDFVRFRALPGIYFFLLAHPDAIEYVLQHNHKNYRKPDVVTRPVRLPFAATAHRIAFISMRTPSISMPTSFCLTPSVLMRFNASRPM